MNPNPVEHVPPVGHLSRRNSIHKATTPHPAKLTVVETVYFKRPNVEAESVKSNFEIVLPHPQGDEQPYSRRVKVGPDWMILDTAWVTAPVMIVVRNESAKPKEDGPTRKLIVGIVSDAVEPERKDGTGKRTRTMWSPPVPPPVPSDESQSFSVIPFALVRPTESARFAPVPGVTFAVRVDSEGEIDVSVLAFPGG